MPTTFIALQCFQCSTMQVKQQKKSSNKWSCVVCNQKQSVRKVFAHGSMARDVRKFVQNFNMSRQLSDQQQLLSEELEISTSPIGEQKMKRNDWTEYVDDQDEYCGKYFNIDKDLPEGDNEHEPMVVTEMPKVLFKKPKVKHYSLNGCETKKLFKPQFPKRSNAKIHQNDNRPDLHLIEFEQTSCNTSKRSNYTMRAQNICSHEEPMPLAPKWNCFRAKVKYSNRNLANIEERFVRKPTKEVDGSISKLNGYTMQDDENTAIRDPKVCLHTAKGPVSKWTSFITEENDDILENRGRGDSWVHVSQQSGDPLELSMDDENTAIGKPKVRLHTTKGPVSKWSNFITEENDDNLENRGRRDSWFPFSQRSDDPLELPMDDERVEDDIHPDFL